MANISVNILPALLPLNYTQDFDSAMINILALYLLQMLLVRLVFDGIRSTIMEVLRSPGGGRKEPGGGTSNTTNLFTSVGCAAA